MPEAVAPGAPQTPDATAPTMPTTGKGNRVCSPETITLCTGSCSFAAVIDHQGLSHLVDGKGQQRCNAYLHCAVKRV